ncbi:response regulator [Variovorax terrae]|uniref:Response regulator n=1 Tax=Variovorax terrae TaxID=2923278 RepID=A0A9X2ALX4_9BURK|nr:response regulator [Variovorax terrae]MCJ0763143.1 response regulator [Variovorax terrae]
MGQRVFVKVVGFTDVERHALNTVFRLSEPRDVAYALWQPGAPEAARLALIDGQSYEARLELESPQADPDMKLIWVGAVAPAQAWRTFERPLQWPVVVQAMDELYLPPPALDLDLDLDFAAPASPAAPAPPAATKRVLIVDPQGESRLYLRTKLASVGLLQADEAASGAEAQELLKRRAYDLVVLDLGQPDMPGWQLLKQIPSLQAVRPRIIVTGAQRSVVNQVRAWLADAQACLGKPMHPGKLQQLLQNI